VSGERIRQIEEIAIKKIKNHIAKLLKNTAS
jgi:DNA-directed RNA polymerase sigma subunit (sigma70/sigma32)